MSNDLRLSNGGLIIDSGGEAISKTNSSSGDTITIKENDFNIGINTNSGNKILNLLPGTSSLHHNITNTGSSGNILTINTSGSNKIDHTETSFILDDAETLYISFFEGIGWL